MATPDPAPLPHFLEPLQAYIQQLIAEAVRPLQEELALVKSLIPEWVNTKEAMRLTGIKQAETLKAIRERPKTLLIVKFEGKTPLYLRSALIAYNDSKQQKPPQAGRDLAT
jgi:hypothetical protein